LADWIVRHRLRWRRARQEHLGQSHRGH
jgi:hypothetical protein